MIHYQMNNSNGVEISSYNLVCRKQANQPNVTRNTADHNDNAAAAQRDDEESASSSVSSSKMMQWRGREAKPNRRIMFDDMYHHFGNQRVDPAGKINSNLAPPGNDEMCFGDLDFDADAAALGFGFEESHPTPNDQRAPLPTMTNPKHDLINRPKEACASSMDQSTNGAHIKLKMEDCASGTGRRT